MQSFGFINNYNDYSLFTYSKAGIFLALLVYVDDDIITGTSTKVIQEVKEFINCKFKIKDLGTLKNFLGIEVARDSTRIFINQRKYALDLLTEACLLACKPSALPMDTKQKLSLSTPSLLEDPGPYRRLVGQLIYPTVTRPDLAYLVHVLSQFMGRPTVDHLNAAHKVLRYFKNNPAQGLFYSSSYDLQLHGFCDADWASCPVTRRSVSGYCILLGSSLVVWKMKKQNVVSRSSVEAEYRSMAHSSCELVWLHRLLKDLQIAIDIPISLYCDNAAAIHITRNPVYHERTKHIEIDYHVV